MQKFKHLIFAFTLIELLVVISIIGLLATLLVANFNAARARARDAQRKSDVRNIQTALRLYYNDTKRYPCEETPGTPSRIRACSVNANCGAVNVCSWDGSWAIFSILLIVIHFLVPYIVLLSQPAKMDPKRLKFVSMWLLLAHLFDLYWIVMPEMPGLEEGYSFSWIDLVFPIAVVGFVILIFSMKAKKNNIIPVGDPKLKRGLDFHL